MKAICALLAIGLPPLFALAQQDVLAALATDFSGRREPVRCQPADTNWVTPPGQRVCVWVEGNISWAPAELSAQGASGGPLDLLVWAMQRRDTADVNQLRDSLNTAFSRRGLQHYVCRSGGHRWQGPGLAVEFQPGAKDSTGTFRTLVSAVRNSAELPKIYCRDVPDVPFLQPPVTRRG
jgi:hypothetical protein